MNIVKSLLDYTYVIHECSGPKGSYLPPFIRMDLKSFDVLSGSIQMHETFGDWVIYHVDNQRIKLTHVTNPMWEAIYLKDDIN